jgi:hypothetical protein
MVEALDPITLLVPATALGGWKLIILSVLATATAAGGAVLTWRKEQRSRQLKRTNQLDTHLAVAADRRHIELPAVTEVDPYWRCGVSAADGPRPAAAGRRRSRGGSAYFNLGVLAETRRDLNGALTAYRAAIDSGDRDASPMAAEALRRLPAD